MHGLQQKPLKRVMSQSPVKREGKLTALKKKDESTREINNQYHSPVSKKEYRSYNSQSKDAYQSGVKGAQKKKSN